MPNAAIIEPIERAVKDDRVTGLAAALAELTSAGRFEDPEFFPAPDPERYTRRLLWRDPGGKFELVAMTWMPGQGTPLHDHDGLWGAEIVVSGAMREANYRAIENDAQRGTRFLHTGDLVRSGRNVGVLVPPLEYHTYQNVAPAIAHTVHVYAGLLERCSTYVRSPDDWWTSTSRDLVYDA